MSREYYTAFIERNSQYEGIFWVGVLSTGIFCRPTCPARKSKYENCRWFTHRKDALLAGFRPCKRCVPLHSNLRIVEELVKAVEQAPEKRWKDHHLREMGSGLTPFSAPAPGKQKIYITLSSKKGPEMSGKLP